jgi:NAD(P)H-hydrate epimerase
MISNREVKVLDKNAEYYGTAQYQLMENAGKKVAKFIKKTDPKKKKILVICGLGNNGGDGFVATRYLLKKYKVTLFLVGMEKDIKTEISRKNFIKLKKTKIKIYDMDSIDKLDELIFENHIIIDSMMGIGLSGDLREPILSIVKKINATKDKTIISVDVPTGLGTNNIIKPNYTITFHDQKEEMNSNNSGEIKIVDIGIPKDAINCIGPGELLEYYPIPKKQSHKGDNGKVLIIGGGPYVGAPALAGLAALRTGSDLVYIATPKLVGRSIASFSPNLIVKDLNSDFLIPGDVPTLRELLEKCDAMVIGPGLGKAKETEEAIIKIVKIFIEHNKPLVIDADAINPIGEQIEIIRNSRTVVTPHKEEFRKLTGFILPMSIESKIKTIQEFAEKMNISIFLKGFIDILSNGKNTKINKTHNVAMTVGGTGDVLAGIIGAMLSKGVEPFNAIRIAAFLNGEAGNKAFNKKSYGLLATDIIEELPHILNKYLSST